MTILNPDHLLHQADRLIAPPAAGPPRQVDLRRAISSAYYSLFHLTLIAVADEFVGKSHRTDARHGLVYRGVDHRTLKDLCIEAQRPQPARRYAPYVPSGGFGPEIQAFAAAAADLQPRRHTADYDPVPRFVTRDALVAIRTARDGARCLTQASHKRRRAFLTLLLCPPR